MANSHHLLFRILMAFLLLLVVVGLVGHFIVDLSGHELLNAGGLHAGFIVLSLIAVTCALTFVTSLLADNAIQHWRHLPPLIHPPVVSH